MCYTNLDHHFSCMFNFYFINKVAYGGEKRCIAHLGIAIFLGISGRSKGL
jgi:hypothetical protein